MDIAEIRKRAKARADEGAAGAVGNPEPIAVDEALVEDESVQAVAEQVQDSEGQGFVLKEPEPAATDMNAGLELLFAATEELVLATDDSYANLLREQTGAETSGSNQYLAFHLGSEEYALGIRQISEIIKVREFTDIPRAPDFILGIISLRGVVVPIYDLQKRLNLGVAEILPASRIVVCQQGDVSVGFLVDSINQVVKLSDNELEPPPGVLSGLDREMVAGIGRYQGRMIILLNLQSVLDVEV